MSLMSQPRAVTHLVGVVHSEDVSLEFFCVRPGVTLLHHCVERFPRYSTIWMHFEEVLIATLRNNLFINISISAESPLNTSTWSFDKAVFLAINSISSFVRILLAWAQPILITIKAGNSQMMGSVWSNDQVHSNVKLLLWPCVDLTHCAEEKWSSRWLEHYCWCRQRGLRCELWCAAGPASCQYPWHWPQHSAHHRPPHCCVVVSQLCH